MVAAARTSSPHAAPTWGGTERLFWIVLIIFIGRCIAVASVGDFPNPYDERAHFSFALHVLQSGDVLPPFGDLRLVEPESVACWTEERNYLNHPSAYYVLMAAVGAPFDLPAADLIWIWRLLNVALAALGLTSILCLGREAPWSDPARVAFAVLVALNPTLPVLGGIVSNDNLAFLGGGLTCLGAFRLLSGKRSAAVWTTVAAGVVAAGLAKLTALLLCGLLLACTLAWLVAAEGWAVLRSVPAILCLIVAALGLVPYLLLLLQYGSPAPFTAGQAAVLASRLAEMPEWRDSRLGFWPYAGHFVQSLLVYWPPAPPVGSAQVALLALPALALGLSLIGVLAALRPAWSGVDDPTARFVVAGAFAMVVMAAAHFEFTFARHQETGWLRGVYPRYYFPLLAVLPAACAWLIERCGRPSRRWALAGVLIAATLAYDLLHRGI